MLKLQGTTHLRVELLAVSEHVTAVKALWEKVFTE
jgi:hypothetical protein